jgi:hypothetical protein
VPRSDQELDGPTDQRQIRHAPGTMAMHTRRVCRTRGIRQSGERHGPRWSPLCTGVDLIHDQAKRYQSRGGVDVGA